MAITIYANSVEEFNSKVEEFKSDGYKEDSRTESLVTLKRGAINGYVAFPIFFIILIVFFFSLWIGIIFLIIAIVYYVFKGSEEVHIVLNSTPKPIDEVKQIDGNFSKYCSSCGAGLKDGVKFCSSCGAEVKD